MPAKTEVVNLDGPVSDNLTCLRTAKGCWYWVLGMRRLAGVV